MTLARWFRRLVAARTPQRVAGPPPSPNGASSCHLVWQLPGRLVEVSATLEILQPPGVDRLYFWALQVSMARGGRVHGGAHLGLQHHPSHPGGGAVNWGGYRPGGELDGSASALPSATGNPNTRDFRWEVGTPYRLRLHRSPERGWRGTVGERDGDGAAVVVRDLWADGDTLVAPMVWSEVFADCDHPTTAVRWSDLCGIDATGAVVRPSGVEVSYQDHGAGGCTNTTCDVDDVGFVQRTNVPRTTAPGTVLSAP